MSFPTVELRVIEVKTAVPAGPGIEAGMVGLQETEPPWRIIRMIIGQPEARAIHSRWKGMVAPRPSTWDLFVSAIEVLGAELQQVVITAVEEERHFFATLEMSTGGDLRVLPCRPSDALALAMRSRDTRIMTFEQVMVDAGVLMDGSRPAPSDIEGAPDPAAPPDPAAGVDWIAPADPAPAEGAGESPPV